MWDREALNTDIVTGPAIIEEAFATHYIATGWQARLGDSGAIIAQKGAGKTP